MVFTMLLAMLGPGDACGEMPADTAHPTAIAEPAHVKNPWVEPARDVLVPACGSCHRPGLPTTNPRALAIFNLHEPVWYKTMTNDQLRGLKRRIEGSSSVDDDDRKVIASFVACEVDGMCDGTDAKEIPK
jgi:hypothetical protein